uniref:Reverse transcriptase domain-containing protein n=1 Tax=Octopus bimaculoides TaxID=37653 RepID=A0A0L8GWC2_OCTBM
MLTCLCVCVYLLFSSFQNLSSNNLGFQAMQKMAEMLEENVNLNTLNLSNNLLDDRCMKLLVTALQDSGYIIMINLSHNHFTENCAEHVGTLIEKNSYITSLDISWNMLGKKGAKFISRGLQVSGDIGKHDTVRYRQNARVTFIQKANVALLSSPVNVPVEKDAKQGDTISPKLFTVCPEMVIQDMNWNGSIRINGELLTHLRFADDIVLIAESIHQLQSMLDELDFRGSAISLKINCTKTKYVQSEGDEIEEVSSYVYLGQEVTKRQEMDNEISQRKNSSLEYFNIAFNNIGNEGCNHLKTGIGANNALKIFDMRTNNITADGIKMFAKGLATNSQLEVLHLQGNFVQYDGVDALLAALNTPTSGLKLLNIPNVSINKEQEVRVKKLKEKKDIEIIYHPWVSGRDFKFGK